MILHFEISEPQKILDNNPILILLHGRGADEFDLLQIGELLNENFLTISIRAPKRFLFGGYTWFDMNNEMEINDDDFFKSFSDLNETINFILQKYNRSKNFILGFSQGAVMAYSIGLFRPKDFVGIIAQSGFLFESKKIQFDFNNKTNFFQTHGKFDDVVSIKYADESKKYFEKNNLNLVSKYYQMSHEISDDCINDVKNWIKSLL